MHVRVLFLARLRELTGMSELMLEVTDGSTAALRHALQGQLTDKVIDALFTENTRLACNQKLWDGHTPFVAGDEIAFLPPVTGG
jgi:sulfur-carrier protein